VSCGIFALGCVIIYQTTGKYLPTTYQSTRPNVSKHLILQQYLCENFKPRSVSSCIGTKHLTLEITFKYIWLSFSCHLWKVCKIQSSHCPNFSNTPRKNDFFCGAATQRGSWPPHSWGFLDHTPRRTTVGRTPLDEWSARRRDLYLTTRTLTTNIHAPGGIGTHDLSRRAAADLRLRPRGYWDRRLVHLELQNGLGKLYKIPCVSSKATFNYDLWKTGLCSSGPCHNATLDYKLSMTGKLVTLIGMMMTVVVPAVISQHMGSYVTVVTEGSVCTRSVYTWTVIFTLHISEYFPFVYRQTIKKMQYTIMWQV
jgi:hypothetical protein